MQRRYGLQRRHARPRILRGHAADRTLAVLHGPMRWLTLVCAALVTACSASSVPDASASDVERGKRYDESETFRRDALVASLQNPENGYSRLRLERYTPEAWEA